MNLLLIDSLSHLQVEPGVYNEIDVKADLRVTLDKLLSRSPAFPQTLGKSITKQQKAKKTNKARNTE